MDSSLMSSPSSTVVTRFAPSPTGYLHIGGARTALFNWLFARHHGGKFLVRIEDTDRERSTEDAVQAIFDGLEWLNLNGDGEVVYQFARANRHREVAEQLLASGHAYRDFLTAEETGTLRDTAKAEGKDFISPWRDREPTAEEQNKPFTVRFRRPLDQAVVVDDAVQGTVRWESSSLDDLVILRSDGAPTYNLAVVVDDHDMGVTHVIRGDDHLNNAARQSLIYDALGWTRPTFAHIPLIHGPDGAKLSKRHGAQAVHEYADMGYLPEAMRNYLARLGWAHGDDELFNDEQAVEWFDLASVNKAPARLDFDKLAHVNAHWLRLADNARLVDLVSHNLETRAQKLDSDGQNKLARVIPMIKDRAKTIPELADQSAFALLNRPLELNEKNRGMLQGENLERLSRLRENLAQIDAWTVEDLEVALKSFAEKEGVGFGKIGPFVRAALTGGTPAPDIAKILVALGPDEGLGRLDDALQQTK